MEVEAAWRSKEFDKQLEEEALEFIKAYNDFSGNHEAPLYVLLRSSIPTKQHIFQIRIASIVHESSKKLKKHLKSYFL